MPFVFISAVFWLLHTWILDPIPNKFRRREFIRWAGPWGGTGRRGGGGSSEAG
jgi:hypothetical protein